MKKIAVFLAALVAFAGSAFGQQYYNISPKYIYEHQVMDSTHVGVVSTDTIWFNKTAATKDVNLYRSSANRLKTDDSLTVNKNATFNETTTHTGVASFANGTAAAPPIAGINDANTGIVFIPADSLSIVTGGTSRIRVDASGNVGIGTTVPVSKLHVAGQVSVSPGTVANPSIADSSQLNTGINFVGNDSLGIVTNGTERIRVDASGKVGIGTTNPSATLTVSHATAAKMNFDITTGGERAYIDYTESTSVMRIDSDGKIALRTNNAEAVRINTDGSVGIGTLTPSTAGKLSVAGGVTIGVATTDTVLNAHHLRINNGGTFSEIVAGETAFDNVSDINVKQNIQSVDTDSIYSLVKTMNYPRKWQYKPSILRTQAEIDRINEATSDKTVTPLVEAKVDSLIKAKATGTFNVTTAQVPVVSYKKAIASIEPSYVRVGLDSLDEAIVVPADTTYKDAPETTYVARYDTVYTCSASKRTQIRNAVLASQQSKATSELAAYEARIAKDAAIPHVSVMAQDMYPVSKLMKGDEAKETVLSGDNLINALLIAVKKQAEAIDDLKTRVTILEGK